jgi:prophage regulatory protein
MLQRILRLPEVKRVTGRSRSSIYADPEFPRPVPLGKRSVGWLESEIVDWQERSIAKRDSSRELARKGRG